MVVLMQLLPKVWTGTFHTLQIDSVLLSLFPESVVVVESHKGHNFDSVPEYHVRLDTDETHCERIMVYFFLN